MARKWTDSKSETDAFKAEVKSIEEWWQTDRQKHIQRWDK
jgi:isocitrate lyase